MRYQQRSGPCIAERLRQSRIGRCLRAVARRRVAGRQDHPVRADPHCRDLRSGQQSVIAGAGGRRRQDQRGFGHALHLAADQSVGCKQDDGIGREILRAQRRFARLRPDQQGRAIRAEAIRHRAQFGERSGQGRQFGQGSRIGGAAPKIMVRREQCRCRWPGPGGEGGRRADAQKALVTHGDPLWRCRAGGKARLYLYREAADQPGRIPIDRNDGPLRQHREGQRGESAGGDDPQRLCLAQPGEDGGREDLGIEIMRSGPVEPAGCHRAAQPVDQRDHGGAAQPRTLHGRAIGIDRQQIHTVKGGHHRQQGFVLRQSGAQCPKVGPDAAACFDPAGIVAGDGGPFGLGNGLHGGTGGARGVDILVGCQRLEQRAVRLGQRLQLVLQGADPRGERWIGHQPLCHQPVGLGDARSGQNRHGVQCQRRVVRLHRDLEDGVERSALFLIQVAIIVERLAFAQQPGHLPRRRDSAVALCPGGHHGGIGQREGRCVIDLPGFAQIIGGGGPRSVRLAGGDQRGDEQRIDTLPHVPIAGGWGADAVHRRARTLDHLLRPSRRGTGNGGKGQRARALRAIVALDRPKAALRLQKQWLGITIAFHRQQHASHVIEAEMIEEALRPHRLALDGDGALHII